MAVSEQVNNGRHILLDWNNLDQVTWDGMLENVTGNALQQSWGYGAALKERGVRVRRIVAYDGNRPLALAQVIVRSWFGIVKLAHIMRGPVWLEEVSAETRQEIYRQLRRLYPRRKMRFLFLSPEVGDPDEGELLEAAGLKQVITGYTTVLVDMGKSEEELWASLYGKWRNQVRRAEKEQLTVEFGDHTHERTDWLFTKEKKQQKDKNYRSLPVQLIEAYHRHSLGKGVVMTAFVYKNANHNNQEEPLAAALFLRHGTGVTYHMGWNGSEGRALNAMNLLLWKAMTHLKGKGCRQLDLGGLNTVDSPELARFKLGLGGEVVSLPGTYL
ncbi:lipid II:glycine glycyltransferase FemX [Emcibacter sp.]|uniref:lipid II:glycine glycyltransferase FemX n=1 Tax=Emcibacter sp. TaxID=1979954 RepID=UPI003A946C29